MHRPPYRNAAVDVDKPPCRADAAALRIQSKAQTMIFEETPDALVEVTWSVT